MPSIFTEEIYIDRTHHSEQMLMEESSVKERPTFRSWETCIQVVAIALAERLALSTSLHVTSLGLRELVCKRGRPGLLHKAVLRIERDVGKLLVGGELYTSEGLQQGGGR